MDLLNTIHPSCSSKSRYVSPRCRVGTKIAGRHTITFRFLLALKSPTARANPPGPAPIIATSGAARVGSVPMALLALSLRSGQRRACILHGLNVNKKTCVFNSQQTVIGNKWSLSLKSPHATVSTPVCLVRLNSNCLRRAQHAFTCVGTNNIMAYYPAYLYLN